MDKHEKLRNLFESGMKETFPNSNLGVLEINGQFSHYMSEETDNIFIEFVMGYNTKSREGC